MAKLAGDVVIYWGGTMYEPGDELPADLVKLNPALAEDGGGDGPDVANSAEFGKFDPDFDADKATVPQLRAELDRLEIAYGSDDRKDALKATYLNALAGRADTAA